MIEYVGKCLLIDKKILVVGDLHLGYRESLRRSGIYLPVKLYEVIEKDFKEIFSKIGRVEKVILLGDVKHAIGTILDEERKEFAKLFELLSEFCNEIIITKGNHDVLLEPILRGYKIKLVDYYIYSGCAFVHGDKDFKEINGNKINRWFIGHAHPAVNLKEGAKSEMYKCFLIGKYGNKEVSIVPSFFPFVAGSDPRESAFELAWEFNLNKFKVRVVGENLEVLYFGTLNNIN